jgi:nitrogen fixation-related uncharacterized protein
MLYASVFILAFTIVLGVVGAGLLVWAARTGQLRRINEQAWLALDERDRRLERPWESEQAKAERARAHGALVAPRPGEWGGQ